MKTTLRILLVALALGTTGAYAAQSDNTANSQYDSQSANGNSANWGVGG